MLIFSWSISTSTQWARIFPLLLSRILTLHSLLFLPKQSVSSLSMSWSSLDIFWLARAVLTLSWINKQLLKEHRAWFPLEDCGTSLPPLLFFCLFSHICLLRSGFPIYKHISLLQLRFPFTKSLYCLPGSLDLTLNHNRSGQLPP